MNVTAFLLLTFIQTALAESEEKTETSTSVGIGKDGIGISHSEESLTNLPTPPDKVKLKTLNLGASNLGTRTVIPRVSLVMREERVT